MTTIRVKIGPEAKKLLCKRARQNRRSVAAEAGMILESALTLLDYSPIPWPGYELDPEFFRPVIVPEVPGPGWPFPPIVTCGTQVAANPNPGIGTEGGTDAP